MMNKSISGMLKVPGARIYYEMEGSGPLLLIIPGGAQDAGVFAQLRRLLADRYTVVSYDPRGNSRSRFDGAPTDLRVDEQADDAAALIGALGDGPALVFGTSGGAQIGFSLAARYPELVQVLLAHEPPSVMLLDDPSGQLAAGQAVYDTYRRAGIGAAMGQFFGMNGLPKANAEPPQQRDMPPEAAETMSRVTGNFEYWLAHGMIPLSIYRPDIERLRTGKPRVVVAIGELSAGQPIDEMGRAVAAKLGTEPVLFPGDHMGFGPQADAFAAAMDAVFRTKGRN